MKVKELVAKYPGYSVTEMGYPDSIPFCEMPKELQGKHGKEYVKILNELEVVGYEVIEKPHTDIDITHLIFGGKKRPNVSYKGYLNIYLVSDKPHRDKWKKKSK